MVLTIDVGGPDGGEFDEHSQQQATTAGVEVGSVLGQPHDDRVVGVDPAGPSVVGTSARTSIARARLRVWARSRRGRPRGRPAHLGVSGLPATTQRPRETWVTRPSAAYS